MNRIIKKMIYPIYEVLKYPGRNKFRKAKKIMPYTTVCAKDYKWIFSSEDNVISDCTYLDKLVPYNKDCLDRYMEVALQYYDDLKMDANGFFWM